MEERFSAESLIKLVHRYYPSGLHEDDPRHRQSEEYKRLVAAKQAAMKDDAAWKGFLQRVREQLPDCLQWDLRALRYDPSRHVRVYLPGTKGEQREKKCVVVYVSILAPVHFLHASQEVELDEERSHSEAWFPPFPPELQPLEAKLDALARESFSSVRLPNDVLFTPVPDLQVCNTGFGKVNLLHCLFSDSIW
ncbi:YlbF family regulator [Vitiosangium sp. GDMCC 1.1324]|uniref:YlbF family regulator n=1 Tax=Vitiosangium sp. (strain GDMCC 1.1324) TaxID=2138576 RepID=UPI000D3D2565|nr:YlbF family regulator [Vitiosangium sp. GDMCC 1.1324]PTL78469.1 hypothetical protein DAT35_38720 [Vitiosangium sp. GDMCC 1.1324]